jgi:glutamine synthetase type III
MKEIVNNILNQLVNNNFKLKYINKIELIQRYNIGTSSYENIINIEVLSHKYMYKCNISKILISEYPIEITYAGEYSSDKKIPTNMWVKMNEIEKQNYLKQQNPCKGCLCETDGNHCQSSSCQFLCSF